MNKIKNAFTLVELLVVIAIIGILVTTSAIYYNKARIVSRDTKRKADMENVSAALELYYSQNKTYPTTEDIGFEAENCWQPLMQLLLNDEEISNEFSDPGNNDEYKYGCYADPSGEGKWFIVYSRLENEDEKITISQTEEINNIVGGSGTIKSDNKIIYRVLVR